MSSFVQRRRSQWAAAAEDDGVWKHVSQSEDGECELMKRETKSLKKMLWRKAGEKMRAAATAADGASSQVGEAADSAIADIGHRISVPVIAVLCTASDKLR